MLLALLLNLLLLLLASGLSLLRVSGFEAALPIPARDIFMARLVPRLAVVWIPLVAAAGAGYMVVGHAASRAP